MYAAAYNDQDNALTCFAGEKKADGKDDDKIVGEYDYFSI
jgi:hypothetical protein